jgi:hypothetical protein
MTSVIKSLPASHNTYNVHYDHSSKSLYAENPCMTTADYSHPLSLPPSSPLSLSLSDSQILTYDEGIGMGKGIMYTVELG